LRVLGGLERLLEAAELVAEGGGRAEHGEDERAASAHRPARGALEQRGRRREARRELLVERPRGELAVEAARDELLDRLAGVARHGAELDRRALGRGGGGRRRARGRARRRSPS